MRTCQACNSFYEAVRLFPAVKVVCRICLKLFVLPPFSKGELTLKGSITYVCPHCRGYTTYTADELLPHAGSSDRPARTSAVL